MGTPFEPPVDRTPQELATELRGLAGVDWETVWNGPPLPGKGLDMWCAQFGWTPTQFEYVLNVRTDTGGELVLNATGGSWAPVRSVSHGVWGAVSVNGPEHNAEVLAEADRAWPLYRDAVSSVLSEPAWEGAWDSDSFPQELGEYAIPQQRDRIEDKDPYHMAYWALAGSAETLVSLRITPGLGTADGSSIGVVNMDLDVYPRPVPGRDPRAGGRSDP
ncbi:hypothetical protein AW27_014805 [Streptomyces sp. PCS3-D2]|uniref:hypothetical protein n=1 Tax=Streptomyces sp. PCS3-D2 TaxID=1460244 RepID=UPI00044F7394|nr:hypothetical protein [Streptomyces sp. PCS3-D2]WKV72683.1 hypothetical protein AW27_014805 [Streptomyces sp. PCS3-D2]